MKQLVLLGGGHAHVYLLKSLAEQPLADTHVTLMTPHLRQVYSGMLPGWIAGHYDLNDCMIQLKPLADAAGATIVQTACREIDFHTNEVIGENDARIRFDWLSIDTGSVATTANIQGAGRGRIVAIRPIESFIDAMTQLKAHVAQRHQDGLATEIAVIGAGAGGVEVTLALAHAHRHENVKLTLISAANTLPGKVAPRVARAIKKSNVALHVGTLATAVDDEAITLANGKTVKADFVVAALGAAAATWPSMSGLLCDPKGYILTNHYLQSMNRPNVFAVGDCATMDNVDRPKSGVYAVRAGPPLAANLRRAMSQTALISYTPQARSLYLVSTGDQYAIGSWGQCAWEGAWVWRWKDKIDRAFMRKYKI